MWQAIIGWLGRLLGRDGSSHTGGGNQATIGQGNQATSTTTTGPNSPVLTAGGNITYRPTFAPGHDDSEVFAELEELMPELLDDLQETLGASPLVRNIVVLGKSTYCYNGLGEYVRFAEDTHPGIWDRLAVLENHGLLTESKRRPGGFAAYRISERLAKYLRGRKG